MTIRVFIVADIRLYREGLALSLDREPGIAVAGSAGDTGEVVGRLEAAAPDVVLLDLAMLDSLGTLRAILTRVPALSVVALAVPETEPHVIACAEAGIAGYVPREASLAELVSTVHAVAGGEAPCSPRIAAGLLRHVALLATQRRLAPESPLTAREAEIIALIEEGLSNKEIAGRLVIEVATVKNHVHNILEKLQVRRRTEAVAALRRNGWEATGRAPAGPPDLRPLAASGERGAARGAVGERSGA